MLFEAARHGFDEISEALARLRSKQDRATVRVSCVPSLALEWLTPRLACFIEQHSDVHIEIFGEWFDIDRSRMTAEGVDIAIRYSQELTGEAPVAFSFAEMIYPVVSPRLKAQLFECQETERCVSLLHDACPWDHAIPTVEWDYWLSTYGMPWNASRRDLFFNLAQLAYRSAIEGVGVAMGRNMIVKHHVSKGLLVPALDDAPLQVTALHVLTQSDRPSGPTAIVLDWLHEQMEIT